MAKGLTIESEWYPPVRLNGDPVLPSNYQGRQEPKEPPPR